MRILLLNYAFESSLRNPEDLLSRYTTLTDWSTALLASGASAVSVLQRFGSDACVQREGVRYFFCEVRAASWLRQFYRVVRATDPHIVHVNGLMYPWQTWWLRQLLPRRTAIVIQDHGGFEPGRNPLQRLRQRIGLGAADAFIFTALELARPWQAAGLITERQRVYAVAESSTRMCSLPRDQARALSGIMGHPALLWVGRLNPNKDPI